MATFADRLKEERIQKNLTQTELAKTLYLGQTSVSKYESGKQIPEMPTLQKIADFFEISIDYLLGKTDIRNYTDDPNITIALHSDTDYDEFPKEAKEEINNFIEYIKQKYKDKK
jgi:transcriptional regulator with XRE-family HTH domain